MARSRMIALDLEYRPKDGAVLLADGTIIGYVERYGATLKARTHDGVVVAEANDFKRTVGGLARHLIRAGLAE